MRAKPQENIAVEPVPRQPNDDLEVGKRRTPIGVKMTGGDRKSGKMAKILPLGSPGSLTSKRQTADGAAGCCVSQNEVLHSKAQTVEAVVLVATEE
jgi:hypothetical protein